MFKTVPFCSIIFSWPSDVVEYIQCKLFLVNEKKGNFKIIKKQTILKEAPLSISMDDYYLPLIEKHAYYLSYVIILGKNETSSDRNQNLRPGDNEASCDYAERLTFEKNKKIWVNILQTMYLSQLKVVDYVVLKRNESTNTTTVKVDKP